MDGLAVYLIAQVVEEADRTMCLPHYTEVNVSCVKLKEKQENIGARVDFLVFTDANNTEQK